MHSTEVFTKEKTILGESTSKIIQFEKQIAKGYGDVKGVLPVLMDFEVDEALSILSAIKREKRKEKKNMLEYEFLVLVANVWYRETEGIFDE